MLPGDDGDFLVMSDNGFGAKTNSADYVLRVYRIDPSLPDEAGGERHGGARAFITLRDPRDQLPHRGRWRVLSGQRHSRRSRDRDARLLTGGDFDIESFRRRPTARSGSATSSGRSCSTPTRQGGVLEAPIPLPGVQSPQNPFLAAARRPCPRARVRRHGDLAERQDASTRCSKVR